MIVHLYVVFYFPFDEYCVYAFGLLTQVGALAIRNSSIRNSLTHDA